jgi:hypothetical protein
MGDDRMNEATFSPLLGLDVDVSSGDIQFGFDGDVLMCSGSALLQQRLYEEIVASELILSPDFGAAIGRFVDNPYNNAFAANVKTRVSETLAHDPAIQSVSSVTLTQTGSTEVTITATCVIQDSLAPLLLSFPIQTT